MRTGRTLAALAIAAGASAASVPSTGATDPAGGVAAVYHQLTARTLGDSRALEVEDPVFAGEELRTGADGRARIALADGAMLTLGEGAVVRVDRMVFDPSAGSGAGSGDAAFSILHGAFRMVSGELGAKGAVTLETPIATIGIRGTDFWGYQDGGALSVVLLDDGRVEIETAGGRITLDAPNEGVVITDAAAPLPADPVIWDAARIAQAVQTVAFPQ